MLAKVFSAAVSGVNGYPVEVEADVSPGMPHFVTVGLPDAAVKESKDRVQAAMRNSGFDFAPGKYTVNLAPADTRKEGPAFDLPIALAILIATRQVIAIQRDKTKALKEIVKIDKILNELRGYEDKVLYPLATQQVEIDLDDGVLVNYKKLGQALAHVAGLSEK